MVNKSTINLLSKIKKIVEKIETELNECKELISSLEYECLNETDAPRVSKTTTSQKPKIKVEAILIERNMIIQKIEEEFKEDTYETLYWLVSAKSKIMREDIITLFKEKGIFLDKKLAKNKIADEVKRILSNRYSFNHA